MTSNLSEGLDFQYLAILQLALASAWGLRLRVSDPTKARQALYRLRKESGDASFDELTLRVSPDDAESELWLLRKPAMTVNLG